MLPNAITNFCTFVMCRIVFVQFVLIAVICMNTSCAISTFIFIINYLYQFSQGFLFIIFAHEVQNYTMKLLQKV